MKRKTLRAKALGGSQKTSGKLCQLFSSFLRGASCPKSPRVKCSFDSVGATLAATAAKLFMPEGLEDVKREICREICGPALRDLVCRANWFAVLLFWSGRGAGKLRPSREQSVSPIARRSRQLFFGQEFGHRLGLDRKSTRLNSSH